MLWTAFLGVLCEEKVYDCSRHSCLNGGTCQPQGEHNHTCLCRSGYSGNYCQFQSGKYIDQVLTSIIMTLGSMISLYAWPPPTNKWNIGKRWKIDRDSFMQWMDTGVIGLNGQSVASPVREASWSGTGLATVLHLALKGALAKEPQWKKKCAICILVQVSPIPSKQMTHTWTQLTSSSLRRVQAIQTSPRRNKKLYHLQWTGPRCLHCQMPWGICLQRSGWTCLCLREEHILPMATRIARQPSLCYPIMH